MGRMRPMGGGADGGRRWRLALVVLATVSVAVGKQMLGHWPLLEELLDWVWNGGVFGDVAQLAVSIVFRALEKVGVAGMGLAGRFRP
jgi:hypothetical protein